VTMLQRTNSPIKASAADRKPYRLFSWIHVIPTNVPAGLQSRTDDCSAIFAEMDVTSAGRVANLLLGER
jgi:hypothetical protein